MSQLTRKLVQSGKARNALMTGGAAFSLVVLTSQLEGDGTLEDSFIARSSSSAETAMDMLTGGKPLMSQCDQDQAVVALPNFMSRLVRHRTEQKLQATSQKGATVRERYRVNWNRPLGEGAFGKVYMAVDRRNNHKVALKKIDKKYTDDDGFQREMDALMHIRDHGGHPNICGLVENYDEGDHYFLALDLVGGGEMFDHLVKMGAYSEADAARLVREIASALCYLHGIGVVHGDMKPENVMLSTKSSNDAVVKVVDFGCAHVEGDNRKPMGNTPAYSPREVLDGTTDEMEAPQDMWALGIILYIMLTGLHPYDLNGSATDDEIEQAVVSMKHPPLRDSPITAHLSESAIELIEKLMNPDPEKRLTAEQMLEDPWVQGKTASNQKMAGSDKKLRLYHSFATRLEAKVFADAIKFNAEDGHNEIAKRTSMIERSFRNLDKRNKGYITARDLRKLSGESKSGEKIDESASLSLSGFSDLLSENMKNKYFPKGHVIYKEGDIGNHMYFINSGTIEVSTTDNWKGRRSQGDFFGEGALMHPRKIRSGTVRTLTPVHAIEVSREYFEKYLANSQDGLYLDIREKDKNRKRSRAKTLLRVQNNTKERIIQKGEYIFKQGEDGKELFILDEGQVDVTVNDQKVFTVKEGDLCGEHSLIFGRPRNTSAICRSDNCKVLVMRARDFYDFLDSSPTVKDSMRDICMRREFQKALVFQTKRPFPEDRSQLRAAFDAADEEGKGKISIDNVRKMLKRMDPTLDENDIHNIFTSLRLDESEGSYVSYAEFERIFLVH